MIPRVQERVNYDRGRLVVSVKVLAATKGLKKVQENATPGHSFEYKPQLRQVVVAAGFPNASDFAAQDLKISLGGRPFEWIHEIDNSLLDETQYFYAYPFHRIFLVDFSRPDIETSKEELEIRSPRGKVSFMIDFEDSAPDGK